MLCCVPPCPAAIIRAATGTGTKHAQSFLLVLTNKQPDISFPTGKRKKKKGAFFFVRFCFWSSLRAERHAGNAGGGVSAIPPAPHRIVAGARNLPCEQVGMNDSVPSSLHIALLLSIGAQYNIETKRGQTALCLFFFFFVGVCMHTCNTAPQETV